MREGHAGQSGFTSNMKLQRIQDLSHLEKMASSSGFWEEKGLNPLLFFLVNKVTERRLPARLICFDEDLRRTSQDTDCSS